MKRAGAIAAILLAGVLLTLAPSAGSAKPEVERAFYIAKNGDRQDAKVSLYLRNDRVRLGWLAKTLRCHRRSDSKKVRFVGAIGPVSLRSGSFSDVVRNRNHVYELDGHRRDASTFVGEGEIDIAHMGGKGGPYQCDSGPLQYTATRVTREKYDEYNATFGVSPNKP